ncbi:coiled-coil domain-containing protein 115-like [Eurosta solidaginis]|uniref:coiled-coil domain-containing protein 115-like n=1 Tax=Eurosta solidaginis TaxID=178769 RepID=UPI0035313423
MVATKEEIGSLLDSLYIEMFDLIEQQTACRVNIERLMNSGQLMLAKTRYLQGSQTISSAQMPTENSNEFNALSEIAEQKNNAKISSVEYILRKHAINKQEGFVEPMHWFTMLPPSSLRAASEQFKKCVELVVESANVQRELLAVMENIQKVKHKQIKSF